MPGSPHVNSRARHVWREIRKRLIALAAAAGMLLSLGVIIEFADRAVRASAESKLYTSTSTIPHHHMGLLLGASKYLRDGRHSPFYSARIDAAVELFEAGKVDLILASGERSTGYDEPGTMKADLAARGIPPERILEDPAGFGTLDSVHRAMHVFGQRRLTIISQAFHNERALYIAEGLGLHAVGYNARSVSTSQAVATNLRERFARVKVILERWLGVVAQV